MWFRPLISRWNDAEPGQDDTSIARLGADLDLKSKNVRQWWERDSIPADWFAAVARAAEARGFSEITVEALANTAERRRVEAPTRKGRPASHAGVAA